MIRKIVFFFIVLFVLTWIIMAHVAKSKLVTLIKHSQTDNIKISYNDASIAGFPFGFTVRFSSPKITITNEVASREIEADYLNCVFNYSLTGGQLEFGNNIGYNTYSDEIPTEYNFQSKEKMYISVDFAKALYKADKSSSLISLLQNIDFSTPLITVFNTKEEELFILSKSKLKLESNPTETSEYFTLKLASDYKSSFSGRKVSTADLLLDASYTINEKNVAVDTAPSFDRLFEMNKATINLDDTSCDITGAVSLSRSNLPQGKLSVHLVRYDDLVDLILPDDFIFSKPYVKKIIAKAAAIEFSKELSPEINFDIELSDKGITLGRVNLLDLKRE